MKAYCKDDVLEEFDFQEWDIAEQVMGDSGTGVSLVVAQGMGSALFVHWFQGMYFQASGTPYGKGAYAEDLADSWSDYIKFFEEVPKSIKSSTEFKNLAINIAVRQALLVIRRVSQSSYDFILDKITCDRDCREFKNFFTLVVDTLMSFGIKVSESDFTALIEFKFEPASELGVDELRQFKPLVINNDHYYEGCIEHYDKVTGELISSSFGDSENPMVVLWELRPALSVTSDLCLLAVTRTMARKHTVDNVTYVCLSDEGSPIVDKFTRLFDVGELCKKFTSLFNHFCEDTQDEGYAWSYTLAMSSLALTCMCLEFFIPSVALHHNYNNCEVYRLEEEARKGGIKFAIK